MRCTVRLASFVVENHEEPRMARRSRQSILKRQRELKRLEKAQLKRQKREERRRKAAEGELDDEYQDGEAGAEGVDADAPMEGAVEGGEPTGVATDTAADRRDETA
jgi:hypothetical protein